MEGDSDIQMVDAPEPSPLPARAYLSGPPTNYSKSVFASGPGKYREMHQPAFGSLQRPSMPINSYNLSRRTLGYTLPSQLAKSRQTLIAPATHGPNFFNTPRGSTASFKNPRIRALPYLLPQNTPRRLSPSEYRRSWKPRQTNPDPYAIEKTGNPIKDVRMMQKRARLVRAAAALSPDVLSKLNAKRPAEEFEESTSKRARIIETQGAAVLSTPMQSLVRRMPGAFPESPEHDAPLETQPLSLNAAKKAATQSKIALTGLSIYARIRRITGVVKGAHRALKQGIRVSTQFAAAVGQRIRTTHEPIATVIVENRRETPEIYESATSAASDQLQADLTSYAGALPPRHHAISVVDPSAQLQAELVDYVSHLSPPSAIVTAPAPTPSTISANLLAQDQSSVREKTMSEPSATPEQQKTTETTANTVVEVQASSTNTVQSTSTSFEVEAFAEDEDSDRQKIRGLFDRARDKLGQPRPEPSPYRQALIDRHRERPAHVTPSETSTDAEVRNTELAQGREDGTHGISSVSVEEHPIIEIQDTAQVQEQGEEQIEERVKEQADEQAEEQVSDEHAFSMSPDPPDNDDEYDPNAYYPGVPPLMPERRFLFNAEFRRKAAAKAAARRKADAARKAADAAEAPIREYLAAKEAFEAAKAEQAPGAPRPILKRLHENHLSQRQIEATIQETVNQLAATTVRDEVSEITPLSPHVRWPDEGINFGNVPSKCRWYDPKAPPVEFREGPEPGDRAGFEAYEESVRRRQEKWERDQQQAIVKQREAALGRIDIPEGESAVRSLTPLWEQRLAVAMRSSPRDVLARTADADLTHEKLETCWTRLAWLNDEVINGHLKHTVNYLRRQANNLGPTDAPKYHAFNSFFYKNLRDNGYQKVSRWATRAKIGGSALLNVETVFIPVHEGMHWTLLVVSPRMRTIEYFDSLGGNADSFVENIRRWLKGELGAAYNESEWLFLDTPSPQQNNGSDCGVFLLTSAKAIALGLKPTVYGPGDISLIRKKIVAELMNGGLQGEFDPRDSSGVARL